MLQKITSLIIILLLLGIGVNQAQQKTVLKPLGVTYIKGNSNNNEVLPLPKGMKVFNRNSNVIEGPLNLLDTLFTEPNPITPGSNFGFFGQDRMLQWFQAPADLVLMGVGFDFISINQPVATLEVKIVKVVKPREELEFLPDAWWGWYDAAGNLNDATAYLDDPERTGGWILSPNAPDPDEIFGNDIWSDGGTGMPFTPANDTINVGVYQFLDLGALGYDTIHAGEIFGVSLKNTAPAGESRVGIFGDPVLTGGNYQYSLWKYYAEGNTNAGQCPTLDCYGWWSRDIVLLYAAIVDIYGDPAPIVNSWTTIPSDVVLGPFTVDANITDTNPSGGGVGVDSAIIQYSIDMGATWNDVLMSGSMPDFTGDIPAQSSGTTVMYRIRAVDINGNAATTTPRSFYIFQPSGANTLVIFNGFDELTGFPQDSYWAENVSFEHDRWNYGEASTALLDNYDNVIEIWNENFGVYNDSTIKLWIEGAGNRNYLLAGQEYLGAWNTYDDTSFVPGDFIYDILGIDSSFNDISYWGPSNNSIGDSLPTLQIPQTGSLFGQPLQDLLTSVTGADSLMYNPLGVYQTPDNLNWQDAFHALPDVEVDMMVETRGIGAQWKPRPTPTVRVLPTLSHRTLPAGNKIVFLAYDPVSLTTANDDSYPYWYWVGPDSLNSVFQALRWFDIPLGVSETGGPLPTEFFISQNYPNPFNPATTIKFSIPEASRVTLKVYDILGEEVVTLVNENKNTGNYEVNFDASNLASGMYVYRITAGNYTASKKMMLLK